MPPPVAACCGRSRWGRGVVPRGASQLLHEASARRHGWRMSHQTTTMGAWVLTGRISEDNNLQRLGRRLEQAECATAELPGPLHRAWAPSHALIMLSYKCMSWTEKQKAHIKVDPGAMASADEHTSVVLAWVVCTESPMRHTACWPNSCQWQASMRSQHPGLQVAHSARNHG
jgi:hypothetical protein